MRKLLISATAISLAAGLAIAGDMEVEDEVAECVTQIEVYEEFYDFRHDDKRSDCESWVISHYEEPPSDLDRLHEICMATLRGLEPLISSGMPKNPEAECDTVSVNAYANNAEWEAQVSAVTDAITGMVPQFAGSSCFQGTASCYAGCATLDSSLDRSLCGMDCNVDLIACIGGEIGDVVVEIVE